MHHLVWYFILLIIVIILISIVLFLVIKNAALFQASKGHHWNPYSEPLEDCYLIIGDSEVRCRSKEEINKIKKKKWFALREVPYINAWHFNGFPGKQVVLYFHGNNDNISYRKYVVDICKILKMNLVLVDYRGYGESSGHPSSERLLKDAEVAYKFTKTRYSSDEIIIWGESLGGIAAIWTASKFKCDRLILLSTFADLKSVVNNQKSIPGIARKALIKLVDDPNMKNGEWMKQVKCPVFIIHSKEDDLIPYKNAEKLYDAIPHDNKELITIGGSHAGPRFSSYNLGKLVKFVGLILTEEKIDEIVEITQNIEDYFE